MAPTKAEIAAELKQAREEIAALREMLAAVSELANTTPMAARTEDERKEWDRKATALATIAVICDPSGAWAWGWTGGEATAYIRRECATPLDYEPYKRPEEDEPERCRETSASGKRCNLGADHEGMHDDGEAYWRTDGTAAGCHQCELSGNLRVCTERCTAEVISAATVIATLNPDLGELLHSGNRLPAYGAGEGL